MRRVKHRNTQFTAGIGMDILEDRKLLAQVVQGVDIDGDKWFLRLIGPGSLRVINQPDSAGNPVPVGAPALIQSIEIAGTAPLSSRVVGEVKAASGGDGKVFFQNMSQFGGNSLTNNSNNGVFSVDIPDFWLGITQSTQTVPVTATLALNNGVNTLKFGGVDMTASPGGGIPSPSANNFPDKAVIQLGIPSYLGTGVFVDKFVSNSKAAASTTAQSIDDSIQLEVIGRLNVFQANEIGGTATEASSGYIGGGGTVVRSSGEYIGQAIQTQVSGAIGDIVVRNGATNFGVQSGTQIRKVNIGGETHNVLALSPNGIRYGQFGLGMDNVTIHTHTMSRLEMNRGAVNSEVKVSRELGYFRSGGDIVDSTILSGLNQNLTNEFRTQTAETNTVGDLGGAIHALIAGNIIDSIFAASVEPYNGLYDSPNAIKLGGGRIQAKVEGTVDNSTVTPDNPNDAFYAFKKDVTRGVVTPPNAPSTPVPSPAKSTRIPTGNLIVMGRQFPSNKKINSTFGIWDVTSYLRKTNPKL